MELSRQSRFSPQTGSLPIIFMFSGQGSQYYQMGAELYKNNKYFNNLMNETDTLFKDELGESIIWHIYQKSSSSNFDNIVFTHPAIFMIEYALAKTLIQQNIVPNIIFGASIGEMAAAVIADILELECAVKYINFQAKLFNQHCPKGGMFAVLDSIETYTSIPLLNQYAEISAVNSSNHYIIAGKETKFIESILKQNNIIFQRLPVDYAFHTSYIDIVQSPFEQYLLDINNSIPKYIYYSCTNKGIVKQVDNMYFWSVNRNPLYISETFRNLEKQGSYHYIDVGASGTLATMFKYNCTAKSNSKSHPILSPYGHDCMNLEKTKLAIKSQ